MNNLNNNNLNILDLPDEIFFIIFKKLNMVDVFYSLVDVNRRFYRLVLDFQYIRDLDLTIMINIDSMYNQTSSIDTQILSKICKKILPQIHHQVQQLIVEEYSVKQILLAANYPQLYSLTFINFEEELLYQYLTDDSILRELLTKQITHFNIDIKNTTQLCSKTLSNIFVLILSLCKKLSVLSFGDIFPMGDYPTPLFLLSESFTSSTLIKLKINVTTFSECLFLLDGRLDSLSTLIINVSDIFIIPNHIDATKKLPKLKYFSFTTFNIICDYEVIIVALLRRMINLEKLKLYLSVERMNSTYIDGIQLYDQFLIYLTQLNKFTFNINTKIVNKNISVELPSNEDIQRSFLGRGYQQVASYVDPNSFHCNGECQIYSLPYDFEYYFDLDNSFQGGMFHKVRQLTMSDSRRFNHKLFQLISQGFPCLEYLSIVNARSMKDKEHSSTLITFPYLTFLDVESTHADYAKLFLLKTNGHLPRLLNLCITYESLTKITKNFTADAMHFNFGKLKSLNVRQSFDRPKNFDVYFPFV